MFVNIGNRLSGLWFYLYRLDNVWNKSNSNNTKLNGHKERLLDFCHCLYKLYNICRLLIVCFQLIFLQMFVGFLFLTLIFLYCLFSAGLYRIRVRCQGLFGQLLEPRRDLCFGHGQFCGKGWSVVGLTFSGKVERITDPGNSNKKRNAALMWVFFFQTRQVDFKRRLGHDEFWTNP